MSQSKQKQAANAIYDRIASEVKLAEPDTVKTLSEAYAYVTYGPQGGGGERTINNLNDSKSVSNVTSEDTINYGRDGRRQPAGFGSDGGER